MKNFFEAVRFAITKYYKSSYLYIILITLVLIPLTVYAPIYAGICFVALIALMSRDFSNRQKLDEEEERVTEERNEEFDSVTKHAIFHMPYPLCMTDADGYITWQNNPFTEIVGEIMRHTRLSDVIPALTVSALERGEERFEVSYKDKSYVVRADKVLEHGEVDRYVVYMSDNTRYKNLEKAYGREALAIILLFVDNLDEVKGSGDESFRAKVQSRLDTVVTDYFTKLRGAVRKYENDKYLVVLDRDALNKIRTKKFDILDEVREITTNSSIPITLSMGVSDFGDDPLDKFSRARNAIDVALGRGGDQAVCVGENGYDYFGGKTKAVQKHTKVKARVIGYALKQLIDNANTIYISGHKNPDMDAIGSAVGVLAAVKMRGKEARMILGDDTAAVKSLLDLMRSEEPEIYNSFIKPDEARAAYKQGDLLILCDHHKPSLSPSRELSEEADNVVVIDHHRRADEFIKNPSLVYLEPHASSASELVTEILQYMNEGQKLSRFESSALLSGIMLDTKNFTTQTGIRTFEAASALLNMGADPEEVKLLFRDEYSTFVSRARAIETSELYRKRFAIAIVNEDDRSPILTAAQVSDELLKIDGVEASFALANVNGDTHLSARSTGKVSVQLIMEALGGGGHIAQAGARVNKNTEFARRDLIEAIDNYIKEE